MAEFADVFVPGSRGAWLNQSPLGGVPDTLIDGFNVVPRGPGKLEPYDGYGSTSNIAAATMMPVKDTSGGLTTGSVIYSRGDTYWYVGSGGVVIGTTALSPSATATGSLQFRIGIGGGNITAGIPVPGAPGGTPPDLAANGAGNMTGTYSIKIAYKRSTTGAIGNASPASPSVSASSNKLKLTTTYNVPAGIDRIQVFASARGFSATGPWLFLSEHTVTPGSPINITALGPNGNGQWADGDRGSSLAPIENFSPTDLGIVGTHVLALGSVMVIITGTGGYFWSFPTKPETYSPDKFAALPGPVVGIAARASDGFAYVWGTNYLAALILTPDGDVIPRIMWAHIGFPNPDAACQVETELWGYDGEPVRTTQSGDPDTSFGFAVADYMRANWTTSDVVVGYAPNENAVVYFHGADAFAYYRNADAWSTRLTGLTSPARAAVTVGTELRVADNGGTLKSFAGGSGTTWSGTGEFRSGGHPGFAKTVYSMRTACKGTVLVELLANLDPTTVEASHSVVGGVNGSHGDFEWVNVHNVESYSHRYSGGPGCAVYMSQVDGMAGEAHL